MYPYPALLTKIARLPLVMLWTSFTAAEIEDGDVTSSWSFSSLKELDGGSK